jgi:hypothetical protein
MDCSVDVAIIGAGQAVSPPAGSWQVDGRTAVPGLYFVGVHWMRKNKSAILYGVGEDAEIVARHIVETRS